MPGSSTKLNRSRNSVVAPRNMPRCVMNSSTVFLSGVLSFSLPSSAIFARNATRSASSKPLPKAALALLRSGWRSTSMPKGWGVNASAAAVAP